MNINEEKVATHTHSTKYWNIEYSIFKTGGFNFQANYKVDNKQSVRVFADKYGVTLLDIDNQTPNALNKKILYRPKGLSQLFSIVDKLAEVYCEN